MKRQTPSRTVPAVPGSGLHLRDGDVNLHAVAAGGGSIWCGCATSPSRLIRLREDFSAYETILLEPGRSLHDLAWDGVHLWIAHASGHLSRYDVDHGRTETLSLAVPSGQRAFAYVCRSEGPYLWVGLYTEPGALLRIDKETLAQTFYALPAAPMFSVRDIAFFRGKVWTCVYDVPGRLIGLDPATGHQTTLVLPHEHALPSTLVGTEEALWVGLDSIPAKVLKIDPAHGVSRVFSFEANSASVRALEIRGGDLWIALHTEPAELVQLDLARETWRSLRLPPEYHNSRSLASTDKALYIGLQNRRHESSAVYQLPLPTRPIENEEAPVRLTSQDWYRLRRGEDQLAWGQQARLKGLEAVVLSRRAGEEFCFLSTAERTAVVARLSALQHGGEIEASAPIKETPCWRLTRVGEIRIVWRRGGVAGAEVATFRKREGTAFDPEIMGRPEPPAELRWDSNNPTKAPR